MNRSQALRSFAAAAGLVAATAVQRAYARDIRRARERTGPRLSRLLANSHGVTEYAVTGSLDGPAVLVSHGAGGGFDQGLDLAAELVRSGSRIIAPSRFGYLRSSMPSDASPAAQADAYARLLDLLRIDRAAIVGVSAGAPSAMQFALRHADRCNALVLLVPAAYAGRPSHAPSLRTPPATPMLFDTALRSDFLFWAASRMAAPVMYRSILGTLPGVLKEASPAENARIHVILEHILPVTARREGLLNDAAITMALEPYDLERITAPTMAISLADDQYGTMEGAAYTVDHIPGARLITYEHGGHVWVGHDKDIMREVNAFLVESGAVPAPAKLSSPAKFSPDAAAKPSVQMPEGVTTH